MIVFGLEEKEVLSRKEATAELFRSLNLRNNLCTKGNAPQAVNPIVKAGCSLQESPTSKMLLYEAPKKFVYEYKKSEYTTKNTRVCLGYTFQDPIRITIKRANTNYNTEGEVLTT